MGAERPRSLAVEYLDITLRVRPRTRIGAALRVLGELLTWDLIDSTVFYYVTAKRKSGEVISLFVYTEANGGLREASRCHERLVADAKTMTLAEFADAHGNR